MTFIVRFLRKYDVEPHPLKQERAKHSCWEVSVRTLGGKPYTVRYRSNTIVFVHISNNTLPIARYWTKKWHPIARPHGRSMGCHLWVPGLLWVQPLSLHHCIECCFIFGINLMHIALKSHLPFLMTLSLPTSCRHHRPSAREARASKWITRIHEKDCHYHLYFVIALGRC